LANPEGCAHDVPSRSWAACTASGCHGDATTAVSAFTLSEQRLNQLTAQIWNDLNANDVLEAAPTDGGYLSDFVNVPPTEFVTNDGRVSPAEGAQFNVRMLREGGADGSHGVHNPFLAEALLRGNIEELRVAYPGLPQASRGVQDIMNGPLGAVTKRPLSRPLIARPTLAR